MRLTAGVRACGVFAGALAVTAPHAPTRAVGDVRGQITLLERDGAAPADLTSTVVYLEPVAATAALASTRSASSAAAPRATEIVMRGREFIPHVRIVAAGGDVAFPNDDPFSHNVFSNTESNAFDLGLYRYHASRSATFARPGVYPIYCNIHHRMVSFVVAVASPYAVFAGRDGRFTIPDVPAGAYVLHAWHERAGETSRPLTVGGTGSSDVPLALDARGYVAAPHPNKFGLPYAATRADRY
ncbi:hypothetical protein tb265_07660 [Gemmatimonadetes bacterium T265]|nr:hypothetical protein tb265_07660 [Gemmatimonadetes bacterium T265]